MSRATHATNTLKEEAINLLFVDTNNSFIALIEFLL